MVTEQSVLETLRRVPDRIILAVMGRDLNLWSRSACLCGWFVRERLAETCNVGASSIQIDDDWSPNYVPSVVTACVRRFGGTANAWSEIFNGVVGMGAATIERAFVQRVDEAVNPPKRRARR